MAVTGSKSYGTTAVQIIAASTKFTARLDITADVGNSSPAYVGFSSAITAGGTDATDGFPIAAGATLTLSPLEASNDASSVWVIGGTTGQKVHFKAV